MVSPKWRLVVHHTWNKTLNNPNFTRKEFVFWMDINNKVSHLYDDFKILLLVLWFSSLRKFQHDSIPNRSVSYPFPDLLFHDLIKLRFQNVWFEPLNFAEFFGKIKFLPGKRKKNCISSKQWKISHLLAAEEVQMSPEKQGNVPVSLEK